MANIGTITRGISPWSGSCGAVVLEGPGAPRSVDDIGGRRGKGRRRKMIPATAASIRAATAAVFQSPREGIQRNPAITTPTTAPAVLIA